MGTIQRCAVNWTHGESHGTTALARVETFRSAVIIGPVKLPRFTRARGLCEWGLSHRFCTPQTFAISAATTNKHSFIYQVHIIQSITNAPSFVNRSQGHLGWQMGVWVWVSLKFALRWHPTVCVAKGSTFGAAPSLLHLTPTGDSSQYEDRGRTDGGSKAGMGVSASCRSATGNEVGSDFPPRLFHIRDSTTVP